MKNILLIIILISSIKVRGQQWQPLQLDLNFIGIGLQSTYKINPKLSSSFGVGVGLGRVSDLYSSYYDDHTHSYGGPTSDVVFWGRVMVAPYARLGLKYNIVQTKNNRHIFFTRYQFMMYGPSKWVLGEDKLRETYQNAIYFGLQNHMDQNQRWNIAFEIGATIISNYDFCTNRFGPLMNLKITYDIIKPKTTRKES